MVHWAIHCAILIHSPLSSGSHCFWYPPSAVLCCPFLAGRIVIFKAEWGIVLVQFPFWISRRLRGIGFHTQDVKWRGTNHRRSEKEVAALHCEQLHSRHSWQLRSFRSAQKNIFIYFFFVSDMNTHLGKCAQQKLLGFLGSSVGISLG